MRLKNLGQPPLLALIILLLGIIVAVLLSLWPNPPRAADDVTAVATASHSALPPEQLPPPTGDWTDDDTAAAERADAAAVPRPQSAPPATTQTSIATASPAPAPSTAKKLNAYGQVLAVPRQRIDSTKAATGRLRVFVLDSQWLVLAGDVNDFLVKEVHDSFGQRLALADTFYRSGELPTWAHRFFYNYAAATVLPLQHEAIRARFTRNGYFRIAVGAGAEPLGIAQQGYWINAVGEFRLPWVSGGDAVHTFSGELVHFAYIRLERPMRNGEELSISTEDGAMSAQLRYHDRETISRAIKVNQCGYLADASRKYAYLGMWLAELGPMPVRDYVGHPFVLLRESDGETVFTGTIALRSEEQYHLRDTTLIPLNGEEVLEMDFSAFTTPGTYMLQVPGVGRSWSFSIGDDAIGRPFYLSMRGLFHQRSGMAKTKEHSAWEMPADRMEVFRGGFSPHDRQYGASAEDGCIRDSSGKLVEVRWFDMVKATATTERLPDLHGGWWDAGDFDRRLQHFRAVECLLSAYMLFPENFTDGQLSLPESGNGLPDILDEALWGMDLWRRAQAADGGVGCWIETTSHPEEPAPWKNSQPYYLALPTRASSLEYAGYAALLARALRHAGDQARAELFYTSAMAAWRYAHGDQPLIVKTFTHPKLGELTYTEPGELPPQLRFRAALALYLWDENGLFAPLLADKTLIDATMRYVRLHQRPYFLCELAEPPGPLPALRARFRQEVLTEAEKLLTSQDELAYRNINWPIHSRSFMHLGWGAAMPFNRGAYFIVAWRLTGDERYRAAALLLADWMAGANPMGRSMTTGLGTVYPVRILSLPMFVRERDCPDPIPGITPYTFTGTNNYAAAMSIFTIDIEPRRDQQFPGVKLTLLPDSWSQGRSLDRAECFAILQKQMPIWRRFANLESRAVAQNEYTVWETIAPAAAAYGALLPKNWRPPPAWARQQPKKSLDDIPGYIFLP
ncbi:MAG: hypothetical protein GX617_08425 [Lentisphaerae bacterium]|nr:hypothetical protein [Lentisphaerota bacterium]